MVVSTAFEELTEVLKCLESSEVEIQNVALPEQTAENEDEITADLSVEIPILKGEELREDVTIEADNFEMADARIDVDLSVNLPVGSDVPVSQQQHDRGGADEGIADTLPQSSTVPAYKDPDALQAVYEEYDTFPEMTEALGADVTSETVRRYMVEYDIHDPNDTPHTSGYTQSSAGGNRTERNATGEENSRSAEPATGESASSHDETESRAERSANGSQNPDVSSDSVTESSESEDTDSGVTTRSESSGLGDRSVAELIAETDDRKGDDLLVADGFGVPQDLTVGELADIVNQSNTIHEAKRELDMSQSNARRVLQELNLIDFVTHRLAADQIYVSPAEIKRRIDSSSH